MAVYELLCVSGPVMYSSAWCHPLNMWFCNSLKSAISKVTVYMPDTEAHLFTLAITPVWVTCAVLRLCAFQTIRVELALSQTIQYMRV